MKGGSFLRRSLAKIPSRMVQLLHRGMLPQHLRFTIKHNQPGRNLGQCFALKCGHFSVGVFGTCFQTIQYCHNLSNRQVGTWRVHLSGMLSPPGQIFEQFLHKSHFQPSRSRPISGVARRVGSVIQPLRRAVPQLIPEGLGTRFHLAVARDIELPFLRPPTAYNPVVYATNYALQSERDCIAQRLDVAEPLQVLADAVYPPRPQIVFELSFCPPE